MKHLITTLALCLGLAACGSSTPTSPQQAVFAAKSNYAAALTVAVAYKRLPACSPTIKPPCSDPHVVTQLQKADNVASASLDAAESAVRTPGFGGNAASSAITAANAAVQALAAITSTLGSK